MPRVAEADPSVYRTACGKAQRLFTEDNFRGEERLSFLRSTASKYFSSFWASYNASNLETRTVEKSVRTASMAAGDSVGRRTEGRASSWPLLTSSSTLETKRVCKFDVSRLLVRTGSEARRHGAGLDVGRNENRNRTGLATCRESR